MAGCEGKGRKKKQQKTIRYEKAKETKLCLSLVRSLSKSLVNEHTNPCTRAPKLTSNHYTHTPPKKRETSRFQRVGPSKLLLPFEFSNILMSQKYHNIKNKCNPFTKQ